MKSLTTPTPCPCGKRLRRQHRVRVVNDYADIVSSQSTTISARFRVVNNYVDTVSTPRKVPRISLKLKKIRRNKKFPFRHPNYDDSLYCNLKTDFQILRKELRNKRRKFLNSSKKLQFILKYFLIISMRAFKVKKGKMLKHYRAKKMPKLFANSAL